jgi:curved DNA-binding protein CbpA
MSRTHYEVLGVAQSASHDAIRAAYRLQARRAHPDAAAGSASNGAADMAAINDAWRVLSDPGRRALYDVTLRPVGSAAPSGRDRRHGGSGSMERETDLVPSGVHEPSGRFPKWPFVLLFILATIFIVTAGALSQPSKPAKVDNLLGPGSCVHIEANGDATEVECTVPHDATVVTLVGFQDGCPADTESHRDRQGRGNACVRRVQ